MPPNRTKHKLTNYQQDSRAGQTRSNRSKPICLPSEGRGHRFESCRTRQSNQWLAAVRSARPFIVATTWQLESAGFYLHLVCRLVRSEPDVDLLPRQLMSGLGETGDVRGHSRLHAMRTGQDEQRSEAACARRGAARGFCPRRCSRVSGVRGLDQAKIGQPLKPHSGQELNLGLLGRPIRGMEGRRDGKSLGRGFLHLRGSRWFSSFDRIALEAGYGSRGAANLLSF